MFDRNELITPHFTRGALASPDTGEVRFAVGFLDRLEELRMDFGKGMAATSGCRSPEYNQRLVIDPRYQAHPTSLHMYANPKWDCDAIAIDIDCAGNHYRWSLIKAATHHGFSVGVHRSFLHLDLRADYTCLPAGIFLYN